MNHLRTALWSLLLGIVTASTAWGVTLTAGNVVGSPGETVTYSVTIDTMGARVGATGNVTPMDSQLPIVDCAPNPRYDGFSAIGFRPSGCTVGSNCTSIKALIIETPPQIIRNNTVLYTCDVRIEPNTPLGTYPLFLDEVEASNDEGIAIPDVTGIAGSIEVVPPPTPTQTGTPDPNPPTVTPTRRPTKTRTPTVVPMPEDDDACNIVSPARSHVGWILIAPAVLLWHLRRRR